MATTVQVPTNIRPFHVDIPDEKLADLRRRIAATRWPSAELVTDSSQGVQSKMLQKLARYWEKEHDWRRVEKRLNALPQFSTTIDGLARLAPAGLAGIHLNFLSAFPFEVGAALLGGLLPAGLFKRLVIAALAAHAEKKEPVALDALAALFRRGYFVEMPEHPQTIGYALTDTPVGMAAWMLDHDADSYEKISQAFLDGHPAGSLTRDSIVDNMTLYWLTNTATSSARLYWENFRTIFAAIASGEKSPELSLPVAFTVFPNEIFQAPRSWAEEVYPNLIYFNEADKGGHFAAWEEPELFASEVRAAFRSLR